MHPTYVVAWLYGVHRTCAMTAAVSRGTSHVTTKERCTYTTSVDIQKRAIKGYSHAFRIIFDNRAVSLLQNIKEHTHTHTTHTHTHTHWITFQDYDLIADEDGSVSPHTVSERNHNCPCVHSFSWAELVPGQKCKEHADCISRACESAVCSK